MEAFGGGGENFKKNYKHPSRVPQVAWAVMDASVVLKESGQKLVTKKMIVLRVRQIFRFTAGSTRNGNVIVLGDLHWKPRVCVII